MVTRLIQHLCLIGEVEDLDELIDLLGDVEVDRARYVLRVELRNRVHELGLDLHFRRAGLLLLADFAEDASHEPLQGLLKEGELSLDQLVLLLEPLVGLLFFAHD